MKKQFIHLKQAWYAEANLRDRKDNLVDSIWISYYDESNNLIGSLSIEWVTIGHDGKLAAILQVFDESWKIFSLCTDLLGKLAKLGKITPTPRSICKLLLDLGFEDMTPRKMGD